jgi:WD40 repeat protein
MKKFIPILLIVSFFACKRNDELPLSEVPGHIIMQDQNSRNFHYIIQNADNKALPNLNPIRLSHDGSKLALINYSTGQLKYSIVNTFTLTEIVKLDNKDIGDICWSPDDTEVAYIEVYDSSIVRVNLATLQTQTIHLPGETVYNGGIDWSPDGNSFVFIGYDLAGNTSHVYTIGADGSNLKILNAGIFYKPRWSPDGRTIAFENILDIYFINADGTDMRKTIENAQNPCWSRDGSIMMFTYIEELGWTSSKIDIRAREIDGDRRERVIYEEVGLIDWCPVN